MSIRAIAYHKSVALEKMNEYFAGGTAHPDARTIATRCDKCRLSFAVVLPIKQDPKNQQYIEALTEIIAEDCINSMHRDEYVLERADH